jgi:cytosine/adenosine deaminase-related metal-dependent hydrolase
VLFRSDLDVVAELEVLRAGFPDLAPDVLWRAATADGADALGRPGYGRIAVGAAPGLWVREPDGARRWVA